MIFTGQISLNHPTNSIKALMETESSDSNQWPGLIFSSFTTIFLTQWTFLHLLWLYNASSLICQKLSFGDTMTKLDKCCYETVISHVDNKS